MQINFHKKNIINLKSDNRFTEIIIEDDGEGYPNDILSKIGEPYLKSSKLIIKKSGLRFRNIYRQNFTRKKFCINVIVEIPKLEVVQK